MKKKYFKSKFNFATHEGRAQISLVSTIFLGIAWILGVQIQSEGFFSIAGSTGWIISFFLIPLMLLLSINFKFKWAFLAATAYGALYFILGAGTLVYIKSVSCCTFQASIISSLGAILGLMTIYFSYNAHKELKIKW